ncbi:MAG: nitroreductase family protein [Candidatus Bathyarchaeota archaeon]|nr:nitroreductase family protein [Candidatus Bathyarchaeota archaeon]
MSELFEAIRQRRSIRKYRPKTIPKELVLEVLAAAGWAPSAHNSQPWRFVILSDASIKRRLVAAMAQAWVADLKLDGITLEADKRKERVEQFINAPVLILACLTMDGLMEFPDAKRQSCERDLAVQSFGASVENLLLAAHAKGLGACWFCAPAFCKGTVRAELKIPDAVEPMAFITMGYSAEQPAAPAKKSLSEYCFVDVWGAKLRI